MEVRSFDEVVPFLGLAGPWLQADAARNNLPLGICGTLRDHPDVYPRFHLWAALDRGVPVAAAVMTEPYNVVVAEPTSAAALDALADAVHGSGAPVPGVMANVPWAERFARPWRRATRVTMRQGVYALEQVREVAPAAGSSRGAVIADAALLRSWLLAFGLEALPHHPDDPERIDRMLDLRLRPASAGSDGFWLWEVEEGPVSLCGFTRIDGGARIGPVYTPPEHRGNGYASNLVAAQTAWLLGRGAGPCFLYTDLANPTSNAIYERIGYERICDAEERAFATD
ncbi:MAG TPA: GNAT family N-acetyltransferase [Actinomycetota bacterium]|nr:GNAT family N-acetyltransferase [Actinomycetota bacterium]